MTEQSKFPCLTHAEWRMLQGVAAMLLTEAFSDGISRCRFGRFELMAQRFDSESAKDKVAMALIVSCCGEVIEYDRGLISIH